MMGTVPTRVSCSESTPALAMVPARAALTTVACTGVPRGREPVEVCRGAASRACTVSPLRCPPELTASVICTLMAVPTGRVEARRSGATGLAVALMSLGGSTEGVSKSKVGGCGVLEGAVLTEGVSSASGTGGGDCGRDGVCANVQEMQASKASSVELVPQVERAGDV